MKGICQDIAPILGSFAGYREQRSRNRMIDLKRQLMSHNVDRTEIKS